MNHGFKGHTHTHQCMVPKRDRKMLSLQQVKAMLVWRISLHDLTKIQVGSKDKDGMGSPAGRWAEPG